MQRSVRSLLALALGMSCWAAHAVELINEVTYRQSVAPGLTLVLEATDSDELVSGTFAVVEWRCSGTVRQVMQGDGREVVLAETLDSGKCVKNCAIIVDESRRGWREMCGGRITTTGLFDGVEGDETKVMAVALRANRTAVAAGTMVRLRDPRAPCWGCDVLDEGLLAPDLVGQTVYRRVERSFTPVVVIGMDVSSAYLGFKNPTTGARDSDAARIFYTAKSRDQLLLTWRALDSLVGRPAKPARATPASTVPAQAPVAFATKSQAETPPGSLDPWAQRNPMQKIDSRTFFQAAGLDVVEVFRALAQSGVDVRDVRMSSVWKDSFTTAGGTGTTYHVAFCSASRPWCEGDYAVGEGILQVNRFQKSNGTADGSEQNLWMMDQTGADVPRYFYCANGRDGRFYCPRKALPNASWNKPFTLRNTPGFGDTMFGWLRGSYADASGALDWLNALSQHLSDPPSRSSRADSDAFGEWCVRHCPK